MAGGLGGRAGGFITCTGFLAEPLGYTSQASRGPPRQNLGGSHLLTAALQQDLMME